MAYIIRMVGLTIRDSMLYVGKMRRRRRARVSCGRKDSKRGQAQKKWFRSSDSKPHVQAGEEFIFFLNRLAAKL